MEINKKTIFFALAILAVFLSNCKPRSSHFTKIKYYPNGKILSKTTYSVPDSLKDGAYIEYYKNGNHKKKMIFQMGKKIDSSMRYFESGNLEFKEIYTPDTLYSYHYYKSGNISLGRKFIGEEKISEIGWSKIFLEDGSLSDSIQYIYVNNIKITNQIIKYKDEKILNDKSKYYRFQIKTVKNSDSKNLVIKYHPKTKGADVFMVLGKNINDNFSNINKVHLDTLYMEENQIIVENYKNTILKGFFYENGFENLGEISTDSVKVRIIKNYSYFNIDFSKKI